ncbi:hypothetical protein BC829DRAFT_388214 [Chytridium lagenaria]|nr:hypothetical protein BC829DRAFT_388214 [Chytridium lagenaria]
MDPSLHLHPSRPSSVSSNTAPPLTPSSTSARSSFTILNINDEEFDSTSPDPPNPSPPSPPPCHTPRRQGRRRRVRRRIRRIAELHIRYDSPSEYFSITPPPELEGLLSNTLFATRISTVNARLAEFKTLKDFTAANRTIASLCCLIGVALVFLLKGTWAFPADNADERTKFYWLLVVGIVLVSMLIVLMAVWCIVQPFKPLKYLTHQLSTWQTADTPLGLIYTTHRRIQDTPSMTLKGVYPPWTIQIDQIHPTRPDLDDGDLYLPLYDPEPQTLPPVGVELPEYSEMKTVD